MPSKSGKTLRAPITIPMSDGEKFNIKAQSGTATAIISVMPFVIGPVA